MKGQRQEEEESLQKDLCGYGLQTEGVKVECEGQLCFCGCTWRVESRGETVPRLVEVSGCHRTGEDFGFYL